MNQLPFTPAGAPTKQELLPLVWHDSQYDGPPSDRLILIRDSEGKKRLARYDDYNNKYLYCTGNSAIDMWHDITDVKEWAYLPLDEQ